MANNVEVKLTATDEATGALQQLINSAALLSQKFDELGQKASSAVTGKIKPPVDELGNKLGAMAQLPGPIGDAFGKIQGPIEEVKNAFASLTSAFGPAKAGADGLGTAMTAAMGPVVLAIAGVVAALAALAALGFKASDAFTSWAEKVDGIKNVTGATAELSSAIAYMGDVTGVGGEQIASMFGIFARQMEAARTAQDDFTKKVTEASDVALQKIVDLGQKSTENIAKLTSDASDKISTIEASMADSFATMLQENGVRASDYATKLQDLQQAANSQAEDLQRAHEARMAALAQSRADTVDSANQSSADRRDALQQRMADLEQQKADASVSAADKKNAAIQNAVDKANSVAQSASDKMNSAKTQAERDAIGAQLQIDLAKLAVQSKAEQDKLDKAAAAEQAKLSAQEAKEQAAVDKADARAAAQLAKQLARLDAQARQEDESYARQAAKDQEHYDKQVQVATVAYETQTAKAEDENNKRVLKAMEMEAKVANVRDAAIADDERKRQIEQNKVLVDLEKIRAAGPQNGLIDALAKMNIKFDEFNKLPVDKQIATLFDGLNNITDASTKTATEMALFGRGGKELNEVLEYVQANGLENIIQKTKDSGLALDDSQIAMAKTATYAKNELQKNLDGLGVKLGEKVTPAITAMNTSFNETWSTYGPRMDGAMNQLAGSINGVVTALTGISDWARNNYGAIANTFDLLNKISVLAPWNWGSDIGHLLMGRASGGAVDQGTPYIVGENGPELFVPRQAGMIQPNVTNYNYTAHYGTAPQGDPVASFALLRSMVSQ